MVWYTFSPTLPGGVRAYQDGLGNSFLRLPVWQRGGSKAIWAMPIKPTHFKKGLPLLPGIKTGHKGWGWSEISLGKVEEGGYKEYVEEHVEGGYKGQAWKGEGRVWGNFTKGERWHHLKWGGAPARKNSAILHLFPGTLNFFSPVIASFQILTYCFISPSMNTLSICFSIYAA